MVDWRGNRHGETFTFKRVRWSTFAETDEEIATYTQFTGGSIEYGAYTALKCTGSFDYVGTPPDTVDLLRVYYSFTDDAGETAEPVALGTFFLGYDSATNTRAGDELLSQGSVTGYGTLKVLQDRLCGLPMTVPAGSDPVALAAQIVEGFGLRANYPKDTDYSLNAPHTFEAEDSYLTVCNWLLTNCSTQYQSLYVDGYGVVQIQPYEEPTARTPRQTFADDERSIMLSEVEEESDWQTAPNVVRLYFESDTCAMWACARNLSGGPASLDVRGGREVTYYEQIDEIDGLDALKALAVTRLKDKSGGVEHVTMTHAYVPLGAGDAAAVQYRDRGWRGNVQNMRLTLEPSVPTQTQLRRFVPAALSVEVTGGVLWQVEEE